MNIELLYSKLPFLGSIHEERRNMIMEYFKTAPDWLADFFTIEYLPARTVFIREGYPANYIYLVAEGIVKATEYRIMGIEFDFIRFDKVYAFGGMEVLMHLPLYRTTLTTVTDCDIVRIPRDKYEQWLFNDIEAIKIESSLTCEYLLEQARLARAYLFLEGVDRLAILLVRKYEKYSKNGIYYTRSNRRDLANEAGLSVKTTSRCIKQLTDKNLITLYEHSLSVNNEQYLRLKEQISHIIDCTELH